MDAITIKESEVFDSNLSMIVPLYPLSKEKFEILRKNSWDSHSIGDKFLAIFLALLMKIFAIYGCSVYLATMSKDHTLTIDGVTPADCWILVISFLLWIVCSFIIPRYVTSKRDEVIEECCQFYERKKQ